jgi:hypothetical protein
MEFNKVNQTIELECESQYAVALSALTHGLRVARFDPAVYAQLTDETVQNAREVRNQMLGTAKPELPFAFPIDAAKTAVAGIRSARHGSTRAMEETAKARLTRKRIGDELLEAYAGLSAKSVTNTQQTML